MKRWNGILTITAFAASIIVPAAANAAPVAMDTTETTDSSDGDALPYLQCVPYARQVSGIALFGDAHTWWDQAEGRYARGSRPRVGAVLSFRPHGAMVLGHVAAVSRVLDSRTVLLRHANWSPINGRRGQVENDVRAVDVSPDNDWSEVRVWYAPLGGLGTTHWPVNGFIYNQKPSLHERTAVLASLPAAKPGYARIDSSFLKGLASEAGNRPVATRQLAYREPAAPKAPRSLRDDPIGRIIASRMR